MAALIFQVRQVEQTIRQQPDSLLRDNPIKVFDIISAWAQLAKNALLEINPLAVTKDLELLVALSQTDKIDQVLEVYKHILSLQQATGYCLGQMKTLIDIGFLYRDDENFDEALKYLYVSLRQGKPSSWEELQKCLQV
jgi:tetratricopeptide (TPR) repeat protein